MILRRHILQGFVLLSAGSLVQTSAQAQTKMKKIFITSYSTGGAELEKLIEKKLPRNIQADELKALKRDAAKVSKSASKLLKSRSANGTKDVEIEICGRRICVTIRFRRRKK